MTVLTDRLQLIPLSLAQMRLWLRDPRRVARQLHALPPEQHLLQRITSGRVYRAKIDLMEDDPEAWWLSTYFLMVRRSDRQIVGELGFKGRGRREEAELGYGTYSAYRRQGYMTEAVTALSDWALRQTEFPLCRITARTREDNLTSQRVLQRSGFRRLYSNCGILLWSKELH